MTVSQYYDLLTALWLSFWAYKAGRSLLKGEKNAVNALILVHFVFCGVPSVLNLLIGEPVYLIYVSFQQLGDNDVNLIYTLYVCACPIIWWKLGRSKRPPVSPIQSNPQNPKRVLDARFLRLALNLVVALPVLLLPFAPDLSFYSSYASVLSDSVPENVTRFQTYISAATAFSIIALTVKWVRCRKMLKTVLLTSPFLLSSLWLNGKRYIVLLAVVLFVLALWERKALSGWRLLAGATAAFALFAAFSYFYQTDLRSTNLLGAAEQYERTRIDFGREHGIKFAIYCELHPEQTPILEYRGESVFFNLVAPIPRVLWYDKPWPYAEYATAAVLQRSMNIGWSITTDWLEESIANFSWLGLALGPLVFAAICRIGDHFRTQATHYLTVLVVCLLSAVQFNAFMPLGIAWFVAILWARRAERKLLGKITPSIRSLLPITSEIRPQCVS